MRSLDYIKTVEDQLAGSGKDIHRILGERLEESDGRFDEICDLMEVLIETGLMTLVLISPFIIRLRYRDQGREMREGDILDRWI